jgi:flavin-dependent dehydrogenase
MPATLIVGGGPAGAAASIRLAEAGHAAILLERSRGPADKVCGDFLSGEAIAALTALGIDLQALGAAPVGRLRLVHGRRVTEAALPFPALGLSRRVLDEALLGRAQARGVQIARGEAALALEAAGGRLRVRTGTGAHVTGAVFLATGKHELRGAARPIRHSERHRGPLGFKTYLRLAPEQAAALAGHVELVLFRGGYAGLMAVEAGATVLCTAVEQARFAAAGGTWPALCRAIAAACPHFAARLAGAVALRDRPVAVAGIPYGYLHRPRTADPPGLFRLGDQAAVIASLTGDGVAIALASATSATDIWLAGGAAGDHHRRLAVALGSQVRLAGGLHRLFRGPAAGWLVAIAQAAPGLLGYAAARTRLRGF